MGGLNACPYYVRRPRPKDEEELSDELARWFEGDLGPERGVIVNREVQPRRGQKTDVYVDAILPEGASQTATRLTVVIEVKGCWNREVLTAMEHQLVDEYLHRNRLGHGIYVVGWYAGGVWDADDWRYKATPSKGRDTVIQDLQAQAAHLASRVPGLRLAAIVLDVAIAT